MYFKLRAWLETHFVAVLIGIIFFSFATRFFRLDQPTNYIFDEVYHAITAKLIHRNDPRAFEWWNPPIEPNTAVDWLHPPLAKYTQAIGMQLFGERSFGWRISSVIFGTLVILVTVGVAYELFQDKVVALAAGLLASFDGLLLTQSRIAMNDIHVTFFILLTLFCYLKFRRSLTYKQPSNPILAKQLHYLQQRWFIFTGISTGLALSSKWSGLFIFLTIWAAEGARLLLHIFQERKEFRRYFKWPIKTVLTTIGSYGLVLAVLPFFIYVLSYLQMFLQGKSLVCQGNTIVQGECYCSQESSIWVTALSTVLPAQKNYWQSLEARGGCKQLISHFSELNHQIWWYQTNLKATHPFQSRPIDWFLDLRPVWFFVKYDQGTIANIYGQGNPALFWLGDIAIFFSLFWLAYQLYQRKTRNLFPFLILLFTYFAVWLPWQLSPRIMFFYHYTPAVPLLAIVLAYWLVQLAKPQKIVKSAKKQLPTISDSQKVWLALLPIIVIGLTFLVFYPNWTGIPVPTQFAEHVYFAIKSWR